MSNRPTTRRSRSVQHTAVARAAEQDARRRRRKLLIGVGIGVPVLVAVLVAVLARPRAPVLDAEATRGQEVARTKGCTSCHTATGERSEGPTWQGIYGHPVTLDDGRVTTVDDAYLERAIREPGRDRVAGFGTMPTITLTDAEVAALVAYVKALA